MKYLYSCCIKALPIAWDCSWTPYQFMCKLNYKVNEIIEFLNEYDGVTKAYVDDEVAKSLARANAYTDSKIVDVNKAMQDLESAFNQFKIDSAEEYERFVNEQRDNYLQFTTYITAKLDALNKQLDANNDFIKLWVKEEMQSFLNELVGRAPVVVNPTTGGLDTLQNTLNSLYDALRPFALTADEYDALQLTATAYDSKLITATDYDMYGLRIFRKDTSFYMYSPFTGDFIPVSEVVVELANLHKDAPITASEYDALGITASAYDAKGLTAYQYDFNGKRLLSA